MHHSGVYIGDAQHSNIGLKTQVDSVRSYHINRQEYVVDHSWMPVRLDLEEAYLLRRQTGRTLEYNFNNMQPTRALCEVGQNFLSALKDKKKEPAHQYLWRFESEIAKSLSSEYPLLRKTLGFKGEKHFKREIHPNPHVIFIFLESF